MDICGKTQHILRTMETIYHRMYNDIECKGFVQRVIEIKNVP